MGATIKRRLPALIVCALAVVLPFMGAWLRRPRADQCALDGASIQPSYRVRIEDAQGRFYQFCCIACAELWLARQTQPPRTIRVADEMSGQEIDADAAYFVRSLVITTPTTGNRIHAFRDGATAEQHARTCHGTILIDGERPFAEYRSGSPSAPGE